MEWWLGAITVVGAAALVLVWRIWRRQNEHVELTEAIADELANQKGGDE